ncbi:hypothetical protein [Mesorhizobium sp. M0140]
MELRAYIAVSPRGINQLIGNRDVMGHVEVSNVGQLPARNVSVHVRMGLSDKRIDDLAELPIGDDTAPSRVDRVIHPRASLVQGCEERDREDIDTIVLKGGYIYVWGVVRYSDGHNERRFTRFCHRYAVASRNRTFDEDGPDFTPSETRSIIDAEKARYHQIGNDAD